MGTLPTFDTIVAPITGSQPAPVAWVRLSGPDSWRIAKAVFPSLPAAPEPRRAYYGSYRFGDDGLALLFESGASYTGEQAAELSIHGSSASRTALVNMCLEAGARMARPGEFTERAFLHGRIDFTQAEGVRDSIEAATELQLKQAALHREGHLKVRLERLVDSLAKVLASIEASIDFSEEIGDFDRPAGSETLLGIASEIDLLRQTERPGRLIRCGIRIAIAGRPNAGKSSLLNALLGRERAIVTEIPGTTRDYLEESADFGGVPVVLVDTAGLRDTGERIEREGIERARRALADADLVWFVYDADAGWSEDDMTELDRISGEIWILANKADLHRSDRQHTDARFVSAHTGQGLEQLMQATRAQVQAERAVQEPFIAPRHAGLLREAHEAVGAAASVVAGSMPLDLATVHLHAAIDALGRMTGAQASADMLERIFADFCIGK